MSDITELKTAIQEYQKAIGVSDNDPKRDWKTLEAYYETLPKNEVDMFLDSLKHETKRIVAANDLLGPDSSDLSSKTPEELRQEIVKSKDIINETIDLQQGIIANREKAFAIRTQFATEVLGMDGTAARGYASKAAEADLQAKREPDMEVEQQKFDAGIGLRDSFDEYRAVAGTPVNETAEEKNKALREFVGKYDVANKSADEMSTLSGFVQERTDQLTSINAGIDSLDLKPEQKAALKAEATEKLNTMTFDYEAESGRLIDGNFEQMIEQAKTNPETLQAVQDRANAYIGKEQKAAAQLREEIERNNAKELEEIAKGSKAGEEEDAAKLREEIQRNNAKELEEIAKGSKAGEEEDAALVPEDKGIGGGGDFGDPEDKKEPEVDDDIDPDLLKPEKFPYEPDDKKPEEGIGGGGDFGDPEDKKEPEVDDDKKPDEPNLEWPDDSRPYGDETPSTPVPNEPTKPTLEPMEEYSAAQENAKKAFNAFQDALGVDPKDPERQKLEADLVDKSGQMGVDSLNELAKNFGERTAQVSAINGNLDKLVADGKLTEEQKTAIKGLMKKDLNDIYPEYNAKDAKAWVADVERAMSGHHDLESLKAEANQYIAENKEKTPETPTPAASAPVIPNWLRSGAAIVGGAIADPVGTINGLMGGAPAQPNAPVPVAQGQPPAPGSKEEYEKNVNDLNAVADSKTGKFKDDKLPLDKKKEAVTKLIDVLAYQEEHKEEVRAEIEADMKKANPNAQFTPQNMEDLLKKNMADLKAMNADVRKTELATLNVKPNGKDTAGAHIGFGGPEDDKGVAPDGKGASQTPPESQNIITALIGALQKIGEMFAKALSLPTPQHVNDGTMLAANTSGTGGPAAGGGRSAP